jgi:uncharacterized membrane protein YesL
MLGRTLKMAFWVAYDHIGKLILANILWFLAFAVPGSVGLTGLTAGDGFIRVLVGIPLTLLSAGVILPVMTAGLAHMVKVLIDRRDGALSDMFRGIGLYWKQATGAGILYLFVVVSFATSAWFYATRLRDSLPWLGYGISAVAAWAFLFALLAGLLLMPALVQKKSGALGSLKLAALLVLANPLFAIGLGIQFAAWTLLSLVVAPLAPLLYGSLAVVLVSSAYEMLARKYAAAEAGPDDRPQKGGWPPKDEEDDYLNRGFRDAIFPWKG